MKKFLSIPENEIWSTVIEASKSRFLGFSKHINTEEDAKLFIQNKKNEFKEAKHICFAYSCGSVKRFSDDGEPSGTAGKPMLDVVNKMNLDFIVLVIVRYFGGIKLGAGPLLRTYSNCAKQTLSKTPCVWEEAYRYNIKIDFKEYQTLQSIVQKNQLVMFDIVFSNYITLTLIAPENFVINLGEIISKEKIFFNFKR